MFVKVSRKDNALKPELKDTLRFFCGQRALVAPGITQRENAGIPAARKLGSLETPTFF